MITTTIEALCQDQGFLSSSRQLRTSRGHVTSDLTSGLWIEVHAAF